MFTASEYEPLRKMCDFFNDFRGKERAAELVASRGHILVEVNEVAPCPCCRGHLHLREERAGLCLSWLQRERAVGSVGFRVGNASWKK